jgi:hypothetical protein
MSNHALERGAGGDAEGILASAWCGWDRFWFRPADPTTLCLMRLLGGFVILYVHLTYSWGLLSYVGPQGWLDGQMADYMLHKQETWVQPLGWEDQATLYTKGNCFWSVFFHVKNPGWIIALHVGFLVAMALFTAGLWTRWTGIASWIGAMSYVQRAQWTVYGVDTMMLITLTYLLIGPSGAVLSVDRWLARRRDRRRGVETPPPASSVAANFAVRLIQIHFCIIYLASGTSKLKGAAWWGGTAPSLVMLNAYFAPLRFQPYAALMTFLASHRWLWEIVMTGGVIFTLVLECGLPVLIWNRHLRWVMICGSILLHTMIGVFMGLVSFSLIMMVMVLSFVPPEVVKLALARLSEKVGRIPPRGREGAPAAGRAAALVLTRS